MRKCKGCHGSIETPRKHRCDACLILAKEERKRKDKESKHSRYHSDPAFNAAVKKTNYAYAKRNKAKINKKQNDKRATDEEFKARSYAATARWAAANPDIARSCVVNWRKANPDRVSAQGQNYRAQRYGSGVITEDHLAWLAIWQQNRCFFTGNPLEPRTVEHVVALQKKGKNIPSNVVLACGSANFSKQDRLWGYQWEPKETDFSSLNPFCSFCINEALQELGLSYNENFTISSSFFWSINGGVPNTALCFWDWEWKLRRTAVLNVLKSKLGIADKVHARELCLDNIENSEAEGFLNDNHLQGYRPAVIWLGLRRESGELLMLVGITDGELIRVCSRGTIVGGLSRLLAPFRDMEMRTWCDSRMGAGTGFETIGFKKIKKTKSYGYVGPGGLVNRQSATKEKLNKLLGTDDLPEKVAARALGLRRLEGWCQILLVKEKGAQGP